MKSGSLLTRGLGPLLLVALLLLSALTSVAIAANPQADGIITQELGAKGTGPPISLARRPPSACDNPTLGFAVIGDYGLASQSLEDVANLIKSWNPDFIITVGDNNYPYGEAETIDDNIGQYFHEFIGNYQGNYGPGAASNSFYPALGNHDWATRSGTPPLPQPYLNYFTLPGNERYYTFTQGPVTFFALDSDLNEPDGSSSSSVQAQWLQGKLAASNSPWKLVYLHHAPYSSSLHGSTEEAQWPYQAWGASAVLAGHDHTYERIVRNGFPYFVNGLGGRSRYFFVTPVDGSEIRYDADYGAMWVEASETCLEFKFVTRNGSVIDTYILRKWTPDTKIYLPMLFINDNQPIIGAR